MSKPPHIVLVMTDQQKASATSIGGNPHVRTPTWDKLATEGVTFQNAYAQSAICTPSRTSIMTGTYPLVHQVFCHQNNAPANLKQLPELLGAGGYRCMGFGHIEAPRQLNRGWYDMLDWRDSPQLEDGFRHHYGCGSRSVGWSAGEMAVGPEKGHAAALNNEVISRLEKVDFNAAPVFLHVAYIEPHPPYFAPRGYVDWEAVARLPLPQIGNLKQRPAWHAAMLRDYGSDAATPDDIRKLLGAYYGMIHYVDEQISRLLGYLESRGVLDNAWIILTSDHGDYAGEKGFYAKSESAYECLLHVPLVIRGPGAKWHAGETSSEIVELIDLFPTILGRADCPAGPQAQGRDLVPAVAEASPARRNATFSAVGAYGGNNKTTMPHGLPESGRRRGTVRAVRTPQYSFIRDPDTGDEAYDLSSDPHELVNLLHTEHSMPDEIAGLEAMLGTWETDCAALARQLHVQPGPRNFDEVAAVTGKG